MLLSAAFLRATQSWAVPRKLLNISSGLGRRPMASQAAYCAAKAGMDHFTRCVALEEARRPNGAKVCSLAPGVIDTDMQVQLRSADATRFPDVGNFVGMKEKGVLSTPGEAAASVLAFLARPDFGSNPMASTARSFSCRKRASISAVISSGVSMIATRATRKGHPSRNSSTRKRDCPCTTR